MIRADKTSQINFPKCHIMSYYPIWIKFYDSVTDFLTGIKKQYILFGLKISLKRQM